MRPMKCVNLMATRPFDDYAQFEYELFYQCGRQIHDHYSMEYAIATRTVLTIKFTCF